jgi:hypothetical protein
MDDETTIKVAKIAGDLTGDITGCDVIGRIVLLAFIAWPFICTILCIAAWLSVLPEV